MSFAGSRRTDVDAHLDALRTEFGAFEVREKTVEVSRTHLTDLINVAERRALGGGRVLVESDDQALLVKESDEAAWDAPGGERDPGEAYAAAARRHVHEQAGIECSVTDVHLVHRFEFTLVEGTTGTTGLWVLFGGETTDSTLDVADHTEDARWFATPPRDIASDVYDCLGIGAPGTP